MIWILGTYFTFINKTIYHQLAESNNTTITGIVANILKNFIQSQDGKIKTISQSPDQQNKSILSRVERKDDYLYPRVLTFVLQQGKASSRSLVKQFRIGEKRADRLMDRLEDEGIIEKKGGQFLVK